MAWRMVCTMCITWRRFSLFTRRYHFNICLLKFLSMFWDIVSFRQTKDATLSFHCQKKCFLAVHRLPLLRQENVFTKIASTFSTSFNVRLLCLLESFFGTFFGIGWNSSKILLFARFSVNKDRVCFIFAMHLFEMHDKRQTYQHRTEYNCEMNKLENKFQQKRKRKAEPNEWNKITNGQREMQCALNENVLANLVKQLPKPNGTNRMFCFACRFFSFL